MPRYLRPHFISLAAAGLLIVGCSDNPAGPSTGNTTIDLATLLAETTPSSLGSATAFASPTVGLAMTSTPALDPASCTYNDATGFFVCPTVTHGGMTFTREFRLIDGSGHSQPRPDEQTSALETETTMQGTLTEPAGMTSGTVPITLSGSSDMTLSGLRTDQHTLNGTSTTTMSESFEANGTSFPVNTTLSEATTNLVLPNRKSGQKWPQSGTVSVDETEVFGSTTPATTHMLMAFNGTSVVTVTFTDAFGTTACHFDMASTGLAGQSCS